MGHLYNRKSNNEKRKYLRHHRSAAEIRLWQYLQKSQLGVKFRRQYGIGNYIVDFYAPSIRLVVEVDGDSHFDKSTKIYDLRRESYMLNLNITTIRVTNQEVLESTEAALDRIQKTISERRPLPTSP